MRHKIIVVAILSIFLFSISYSAESENIYTWKDKHGVLNITDQAPPNGAEIIDIRPSHRIEAEKIQRSRLIRLKKIHQEQERQQINEQLSEAERIEKEAFQTAEEFKQKINELIPALQKAQDEGRQRIYRKRIQRYEEKFNAAVAQTEKAKKQREILEERLSNQRR